MVSGRAYFPSPVVGSIQPFRVFADHALAASGGTFSKESFLSGPQLFIHTSRPNWGRAILAAEADDRRHYQFEDGRVRTIARDFYDLLQPVNPEEAVAKKAARRLLTLLKHSDFDEPTANTPSVSMTFGDQIALFKAALPEGFEAEAYKTAFRDASRRKRAHVDASIEASRENLAVEKLDALIEAEDWKGGWKVISDVLMGCDLLSSTERKAVRGIEDEESAQLLTLAVRDLLHGDDVFAERFKRFLEQVEETEMRGSWSLVTALPALHDPEVHVCIRATAFRDQAKILMPQLRMEMKPELPTYEVLQMMAVNARDQLIEAKVQPRDLFDVRNFMWLTLRKDADRKLRAL